MKNQSTKKLWEDLGAVPVDEELIPLEDMSETYEPEVEASDE